MADGKAGPPEGNQNAARQQREVTNALRRAATQNPNKLKKAAESVLNKAAEGDLAAFNVLADRLDGKPIQSVEGTGENGVFTIIVSTDDESVL